MIKKTFSKADLNSLIDLDDIDEINLDDDEDYIIKKRVLRKSDQGIDPRTTHKKSNPHKDKKRYIDDYQDENN